ncbi:MAG: hypothetical protein IKP40_01595 [Clostridia bacterium]|nr:hypothetical protein [Clostridia bacterium]
MPQKIDIHGLFLNPEEITELRLQKRISVFIPVFQEIPDTRKFFGRLIQSPVHKLQFVSHQPYGIILADAEQPDPSSYVVTYRDAVIERFLRGIGQAGKSIVGHIQDLLKIEISGSRRYRILQSGRQVKETTIREIPAKVRLLSGQWVDVFKDTPNYDFQGGTPYAVTEIGAASLMICTNKEIHVLFGAGVDATDEEVTSSYKELAEIYNQIQAKRDAAIEERKKQPLFQLPQINLQLPKVELPKVELPKVELPKIRFPFAFPNGGKEEAQIKPADETAQQDAADGEVGEEDKN